MYQLRFILVMNYSSFIWIELSLEGRDAKIDGFPRQYIGQQMQLNKGIKMKRSSQESMEEARQLIE